MDNITQKGSGSSKKREGKTSKLEHYIQQQQKISSKGIIEAWHLFAF